MATEKAKGFAMPTPGAAPDADLLRALDFMTLDAASDDITIDASGALSVGVYVKAYIDGRYVGMVRAGVKIAPDDLRWMHVDTEGVGFRDIWKE